MRRQVVRQWLFTPRRRRERRKNIARRAAFSEILYNFGPSDCKSGITELHSDDDDMKIFGVAMNYPGHNIAPESALYDNVEPVVFTKADSALLKDRKPFFVPDWCRRVDHEAALVVRICRLGKCIPERFAHRYYDAVTVGVDFTASDVLAGLRSAGLPWEVAKGFDGSAAIGQWVDKELLRGVQQLRFRLDVNGVAAQEGYTGDMLFGIDSLIARISRYFTLKTGDLLFTGTPAGVGPVAIGDHLEGYVEDRKVLDFNCK